MTTRLREAALTETYQDVEKLIKHTVMGFIRRFGTTCGTFDELFAQANESFMMAVGGYKPDRGASFSTWCRWVVSKGLSEHQRRAILHNQKARIDYVDMDTIVCVDEVDRTRPMIILDELTGDAKFVAVLTLNPPPELQARLDNAKGRSGRNQLSVIRQYLYGIDWDADRANKAFEEIRKVLDD